ncbi:hypothetical protein D779_0017 [Imhoffiella purpurea]|uniref:Uncharacterized protein n=1 Tax=Imhoffiella purpurea TaxID=1249627 RepID=W9W3Q2_9GAMM|nr:hypothetical protein D779_0017 [Imhoffiella purpurea]
MLSFVGAALLLSLAAWGYYRSGDPLVAPTLILSGESLQLTNGSGRSIADGVRVEALGSNGNAMVQGVIAPFEAAAYRDLAWRVEGLSEGTELRLIWAEERNPRAIQARPVSTDEAGLGRILLESDPGWQGRIVALGLVVLGELRDPILVRRIELHPRASTIAELRDAFIGDWAFFEGWTGRSPHFNRGAPIGAPFQPVVLVALWVGLASLLYASIIPPWRFVSRPLPYVAFFLIGWAVLDLRWQWDLVRRLDVTEQTYAGLDETGKQLAGPDRNFYPFLMELRQRLSEDPSRVIVLASDPFGYAAMRTRYHLAPYDLYSGLRSLPDPSQVRAGDYILLMFPLSSVRYDQRRRALIAEDRTLPVDRIEVRSTLGALFRVREED